MLPRLPRFPSRLRCYLQQRCIPARAAVKPWALLSRQSSFYSWRGGASRRKPGWHRYSSLRHPQYGTPEYKHAAVTAVPLGLLMGTSRIVRGIFDPLLEFYRPLPPLAYLPLIVIWFGIDETAKILLIYLACFAPIAVATRAGVTGVLSEQLHAALSMGASRWQLLRHIILPASLPDILTGLRIAIGFGWTTLVAAEMVAATAGVGQLVLNASNFLRTDIVVMGIILIGIVAYLFDLVMRRLEHQLVPWKDHR